MKLVKETNTENEIKKVSDKEAEEAFKTILSWMGEDPNREGLLETPKRVVKAFKEYFKGYTEDPSQILDKTFGDVEGYDDMVIQKNISVQSHCEHHMAPIIGKAHVAYIPKERVVGLSKLARVVEVFSKRLQTQERLTMQIANTLMQSLDAKGVAVTGVINPKTMFINNYVFVCETNEQVAEAYRTALSGIEVPKKKKIIVNK